MFNKVSVPVLGMIQNMATHVCSNCGHEDPIFGSEGGENLANEYDSRLLANIPLSRRIRETSDAGEPIVLAEPGNAGALAYRDAASVIMASLDKAARPAAPTISMTD